VSIYKTMCRNVISGICAILFVPCFMLAQQVPKPTDNELPCAFKGELLESAGKPKWLASEEMKRSSLRKVDVGALLRNADVSATTVIANLIVGTDGSVACLKIITHNHPLITGEVEWALKQWKFRPMENLGKAVAYAGVLEFQFCRVGCVFVKNSVTLLE
jgi:hypothetical protein